VAVTPVSVSAGSRGTFTHSCDSARLLVGVFSVSHWFSPAALAALSATSAALLIVAAASSEWPFVKGLVEPSSISVRPAWAIVGSVPGTSLVSAETSVDSLASASGCWKRRPYAADEALTWASTGGQHANLDNIACQK
jgi:hypothetical protein